MKTHNIAILLGLFLPFAAFGAREGTPIYYQNGAVRNANQTGNSQYASAGYSRYVGQSGQKQVVGQRSYTYQTVQPQIPRTNGTMTANGVAVPVASEPATTLYADYTRRIANFEFKTGVNSILEWDDMLLNEITVGVNHNFSLRDFDLFAYAEYTYGSMNGGGMSMDYDLEPYDYSDPTYGIFTISMGDMSGSTSHLRFGIGAKHIWDIGGWKLSPSIGYEIFKHNLEMSNHIYPNPGTYLPLLTDKGDYVFGDAEGNFYTVPVNGEIPDDWYQVCMSPEDIKLVPAPGSGYYDLGKGLSTENYNPDMGDVPWGVSAGECVIIGGDGMVVIEGTTHIYDTTWSGIYVGLEIEKQMTLADKLRFYFQFGLPEYSSEGTWPNRTDWQQHPSFLDEGDNGAYSYRAEMEYNYKLSDRLQLALKVDTHFFHVGKIGGELYVAEYTTWALDENGGYALDENGLPYLVTTPAHTEYISDSLKHATWQSFGLHLGLKYAF